MLATDGLHERSAPATCPTQTSRWTMRRRRPRVLLQVWRLITQAALLAVAGRKGEPLLSRDAAKPSLPGQYSPGSRPCNATRWDAQRHASHPPTQPTLATAEQNVLEHSDTAAVVLLRPFHMATPPGLPG